MKKDLFKERSYQGGINILLIDTNKNRSSDDFVDDVIDTLNKMKITETGEGTVSKSPSSVSFRIGDYQENEAFIKLEDIIYGLTKELNVVGYADAGWDYYMFVAAKNGKEYKGFSAKIPVENFVVYDESGVEYEYTEANTDYRDCWTLNEDEDVIIESISPIDMCVIDDNTGIEFEVGTGMMSLEDYYALHDTIDEAYAWHNK